MILHPDLTRNSTRKILRQENPFAMTYVSCSPHSRLYISRTKALCNSVGLLPVVQAMVSMPMGVTVEKFSSVAKFRDLIHRKRCRAVEICPVPASIAKSVQNPKRGEQGVEQTEFEAQIWYQTYGFQLSMRNSSLH
jgi:hypothetical protein